MELIVNLIVVLSLGALVYLVIDSNLEDRRSRRERATR